MFPSFIPHPLVRGGHAQTILGCYLPGMKWAPQSKQHLVALPDGDRIVLHEDVPLGVQEPDRVVLLIHGLGGSHQSTYMQRTAAKLVEKGVRVFRMDLRGCGAGTALAKLPVHAGRSEDVGVVLAYLMEACADTPIFLVGFSMGGNLVLKLLGEMGRQRPANLAGAMAVAPPIDLIDCSRNMERGVNRLYNRSFLRSLLRAAAMRRERVPKEFDPPLLPLPQKLRDFDERFTAPLAGYASAEEYYHRASSRPLLQEIQVPTVVVAAADDPIVPVGPFESATYSQSTQLLIVPSGGHLGFFGVKGADPDRRWMDWRVVDWVISSAIPKQRWKTRLTSPTPTSAAASR